MKDDIENKPVSVIEINKRNTKGKLTLVSQGEAPNVELGVSEIINIVLAVKEVKEAYDTVMADGKVTLSDFLLSPKETLYDVGKALLRVYEGHQLIIPQLEDIEYHESEEIINAVVSELGVTGENAKTIIDNSIKGFYHLYTAAKAF